MKFSYNLLQSFVSSKLPKPEDLVDLIMKHSFEVEGLEKVGSDYVLDIDVLPNRAPDCFAHMGMARESAVLSGLEFKDFNSSFEESKRGIKGSLKVEIKEKDLCKRYTSRIVRGVKIGESPKYIKEALISCGLRPINNIVDITNYVMLETGQPLHAFDLDKINEGIVVRKAKAKEEITTLDNEKIILDKDVLVISDKKYAIGIAGIKGGTKAKIDNDTFNIVIESANFDQKMIRKTSRKINLRTDASLRYEHNISLDLTEKAINRVVKLILDIAGGEADKGMIDVKGSEKKIKEIKLDIEKAEKVLGVSLDKKKSKKILETLGFEIKEKGKLIYVKPPLYRMDIEIEEDLIEELGRINGYDKIQSSFPQSILFSPERNENIFWEGRIEDSLVSAGLTETYTYSFISEKDKEVFSYRNQDLIELENPLSVDYKYMRPSLIPNLLKVVQKNQADFDDIEVFEIGAIFKAKTKGVLEKRMITGAIKLNKESFYEMKGALDSMLNGLGISDIYYDEYQATPEDSNIDIWHTSRIAEIKVGGKEIGFLGEINEDILRLMKIKGKVTVFDIDFDIIKKLAKEEHNYQEISSYPEAVRDLSIIVPNRVKVVEVLNVINRVGGEIIRDVDLFDIYEGSNLEEGMKSLAFHIIYQSQEKTLKSKEIDEIQQKIIKELENNLNWQVRK